MRQFRFRKLTDGSVVLSEVQPNPSGLSNAKDTEVPILTLTPEEAAAVEHEDESVPVPPVEDKAAPVVVPDLPDAVPSAPVVAPVVEPIPDVPPVSPTPASDVVPVVVPDPMDPHKVPGVAVASEASQAAPPVTE